MVSLVVLAVSSGGKGGKGGRKVGSTHGKLFPQCSEMRVCVELSGSKNHGDRRFSTLECI